MGKVVEVDDVVTLVVVLIVVIGAIVVVVVVEVRDVITVLVALVVEGVTGVELSVLESTNPVIGGAHAGVLVCVVAGDGVQKFIVGVEV